LIRAIIRHWLPLAVIATGLCGQVYVTGQQVLRLGGYEPQIQMAQDAASQLSAGAQLASVAPTRTLDVGASLAPFTIIYDDTGSVLAATGQLHGQPPSLPGGVLDNVRQHGEDRISWQPEAGTRYAAAVERVAGTQPGFVLVARSLRETEQRISVIQTLALAGWLVLLAASLVAVVAVEMVLPAGRACK